MLTIHGQHHPIADIWSYFPRKEGGIGLMQIEGTHIVEVTILMEYVKVKKTYWCKLLGHTSITQHHFFKQLRILRNIFKVKQSKLNTS
jgi:hypothetical protein